MNPAFTMASSVYAVPVMNFSQRLISLRRECRLTQQGLANATNIQVQQIKRYESGTSQPSAEALKKIAKAFAVTTDWLLFEENEELRLQFEALSAMPPEEKALAKAMLEAIMKNQVAGAVKQLSARPAAKAKKLPARERARA